ncbi:uncharacterized protein LOC129778130 [Toxorhynchites rutilus septentrionalis]|uniref:uncharacterized protein LOC129778130 n=1 Tax=Toxorhynchites rutilus septentrionalis TaxID=329112 RepID=UPI00247AE8F9|nr:uncharacterized protein LOC129778130 [Toxorhynchites rutilus septentrionalis]XP_055640814.1 uncharacterized protein LOC129778130 [Toxorhynchites rutilus septentrionalis]XP_055640815.1 uncharacterized protein LOC129778130 [Toxorhynchites rutilus septentrionalis]XP_055640816.1 uncharacterized protein LOC129778130 [Toxorhynchites rutilus septentrionalis]
MSMKCFNIDKFHFITAMSDHMRKNKIITFKKSGSYSRLLTKHRNRWREAKRIETNMSETHNQLTDENGMLNESTKQNNLDFNLIPGMEQFNDLIDDGNLILIFNDFIKRVQFQSITGNHRFFMDLQKWTSEYRISQTALKSLITILKTNLELNMPRDPRTLMQIPKSVTILNMKGNGQYWHQGLELCLKRSFNNLTMPMTISLNINIDGLPLFRNSMRNFWPIVCNIYEQPDIPPVVIGIFHGIGKPKCVFEYLSPFVDEILPILKSGLVVNGHILTVKIRCFICDTPARSFIKGVVNFNGKFGCIKCTTEGQYCHTSRTMIYPDLNAPKPMDEMFREKKYQCHQVLDTPLAKLPIDIIEDVIVADSLHLLELGVMRRLLNGWRTGSLTSKLKWSTFEKNEISKFLCSITFPSELHRRMRSLEFISLWKGLEYRYF